MPLIKGVVITQDELVWNPLFASVALGMEFSVENIWATAAYDDYLITFAQPIMETTNRNTVALLQTAMREGWSVPQMQDAIGVLFERYLNEGVELTDEQRQWFLDRIPRYRLENIARSETIRASNWGSLQLFIGYGAPMKEWLATPDSRVRDAHLDAMERYSEGGNPGPILVSEPFILADGSRLMFPGDSSLGAPLEQILQCRCTVAPYSSHWANL